MREPSFWWREASWQAALLAPVAAIYGAVAAWRMRRAGAAAGVPVICVGNFHTGGAGKTPTAILVARLVAAAGERPVFLTRGYGGTLAGPVRVDPARHGAADVGDEPLLLERVAPVIVARDRVAGARAARAAGASVIIMDDGFQNPALRKDLSLNVIDAARGVGNGGVLPAGPLRAPLAAQLARTDAMIEIDEPRADRNAKAGADTNAIPPAHGLAAGRTIPRWRARFRVRAGHEVARGKRVLAFAGIGDPARFFATLRAHGVDVAAREVFPDHHPFSADDLARLAARAAREGLTLMTTEKDHVRLASLPGLAGHADGIEAFAVALEVEDEAALTRFLMDGIGRARTAA